MKKLLVTATAILLVSAAFISCKKEKEEIPAQQEQPTTLNQGNGIMETIQRGPNGTNVVFSNWIQPKQILTGYTGCWLYNSHGHAYHKR